jgi:uncharacterized OsmC-like protein
LQIALHYSGGALFAAEARHHRVLLDQPTEDGATDQGMSPAELLLASLGGCVGQHVAQYLSLRGLSRDGLSIRVETQPATRPLHFGDFHVEVTVPGLNDRQRRALEESFPAGLVHNALRCENRVSVTAAASRKDPERP